jgi:hypothetical protein
MDVLHFLSKRTAFVRQFYKVASSPYLERKRKIEAGEEPFVPPHAEDAEPAFLEEWVEADESLDVLGYLCLGMLSAALRCYFKTWEKEFDIPTNEKKFRQRGTQSRQRGYLNVYKAYFAQHADIHFENGPSDLRLLEEVALVRNRTQHPESHPIPIVPQRALYSCDDLKKIRRPFFVDDRERALLADMEEDERLWLMPTIHVTKEKLSTAIEEVEKFTNWLEAEILKALRGNSGDPHIAK